MQYLYDDHLGGIFVSDKKLTIQECYCATCHDYDTLIGEFETLSDFWNLIKNDCSINGSGGYSLQYIFPVIVEEFKLPVDIPYADENDKAQGFCSLTDKQILKLIRSYATH